MRDTDDGSGFEKELNYSKSDTVPFAPLHREIGVSFVLGEEFRELNEDRQKKIYEWVESIEQPYDMIQRAEGWATPEKVYYGGQEKAVKYNEQSKKARAVTYGKAGRAAIRRHYRTTYEHLEIAEDRYEGGKTILFKIRNSHPFDSDDTVMIIEILQELANGIAANLENKFPGGDEYARIAGNSILHEIDVISQEGHTPHKFTTVIAAGVNFVGKQSAGWKKAIRSTESFAEQKEFPLTREEPEV